MTTCGTVCSRPCLQQAGPQERLHCGDDMKGEVAVDLHNSEPESIGLVMLCHHDGIGACPGQGQTLLDQHFQPSEGQYTPEGRLNPDTLNRHAATCHTCLRRLLGCARDRGCDNSWATLEGVTAIIATKAASRQFKEQFYLLKEGQELAAAELLVTVWRSASLDPSDLDHISNLSTYLYSAATTTLLKWLRKEKRQQGLWKGGKRGERNLALDGMEDPYAAAVIRTAMEGSAMGPDAMAVDSAEARSAFRRLNELLADFAERLRTQRRGADQVALLQYWIQEREQGRFFNQSAASRALKARGIEISQSTVHRWFTAMSVDWHEVLQGPDNGLSQQWREHFIRFFFPPKPSVGDDDVDPRTSTETPPIDPTPDNDSEAGSDDD